MDLVGIICNSDSNELLPHLRNYLKGSSTDNILYEIRSSGRKKELTGKIRKNPFVGIELLSAAGITALESITPMGSGNTKGYRSLICLAGLIAGKRVGVTEAGKVIKEWAKTNGLPDLTDETREWIEGLTPEYIRSRTQKQLREDFGLHQGRTYYSKNMPYSYRNAALLRRFKEEPELVRALLERYARITALESITPMGSGNTKGYSSLTCLAGLIAGKRVGGTKVGKVIKEWAKANRLPDLTDETREWIEGLTPGYIRSRTQKQLREDFGLYQGRYSLGDILYLAAVSRRFKEEPELVRALLERYARITALESITPMGSGNTKGYHSLRCLAGLIAGRSVGVTEAGKVIKEWAKANGLPDLTDETREWIEGLTPGYIRSRTQKQLREDFGLHRGRYSLGDILYLAAVSRRFKEEPELVRALLETYVGISFTNIISDPTSIETIKYDRYFARLVGLTIGKTVTPAQAHNYMCTALIKFKS